MKSFNELYELSNELSVLLVEDDVNLITQTVDILDDLFEVVSVATNGEEGLINYNEYYEENGYFYDIIITDLNMPIMDGIEMIERIYKINSSQPVIVVSAYNDSQRLLKLIELGISHFLLKPVDPKKMIDVFYRTCSNIYSKKQKENYYTQQAKLIGMGEMIDSIAHQWLQPIGIMKLQTQTLQYENSDGVLDKTSIDDFVDKQLAQIEHITGTLKEFREFFRSKKEFLITTYDKMVQSLSILLKDTLVNNCISFKIDMDDTLIKVIPNEFKHVLINIVNNSIDAYSKEAINDKKIEFYSYSDNKKAVLEIKDHAGGIDKNIIENIFDINFTTKGEKGSGVGLYLSKRIVEKVGGKIYVESKGDSTVFRIYLDAVDE